MKPKKQYVLEYLDRIVRNCPVTTKKICHSAYPNEVLSKQYVDNIMRTLEEWESVPCWSRDGYTAWVRKENKCQ